MNILESTQLAYFQHFGATGKNVSLSEILDGIKGNAWKGQVKRLRAKGRKAVGYDDDKKKLPAFMLSGTTNGGHKAADVVEHSGLLQIDVDKIGADKVADVRDRLGDDRHILAAWVSPSGDGVKAIMRIPADLSGHKAAFAAAADYMRDHYAIEIDKTCSDVSRLCFVSHDPEIVVNGEVSVLDVKAADSSASSADFEGVRDDNSSTSLNPTSYILHNSPLFDDFPNLRPLYQTIVAHRYGKPQRGTRNQAMVEIVAMSFFAVSPDFVKGFAVEYYRKHADVFADYNFETYEHEVDAMMAGCLRDYPQRLPERERDAYETLACDRERAAFRIAQSLSKCESDATVLPPLFHLSAAQLATRLGIMDMQAWRILKAFEKSGFIQIERLGTKRTKGAQGIASVYRWML